MVIPFSSHFKGQKNKSAPENNGATINYDFKEVTPFSLLSICKEAAQVNKISITKAKSITLPSALHSRIISQCLLALFLFVMIVTMSVWFREWRCLLLLPLPIYFLLLPIKLRIDFSNGQIAEIAVVCASVNPNWLKRQTRVVFTTYDEHPTYYEFIMSGNKLKGLFANYAYIIYYDKRNPERLLGFVQV